MVQPSRTRSDARSGSEIVPAPLAAAQPQPPPTARRADGRPFATPLVRALAAARGIDLTDLRPARGWRRIDITDLEAPASRAQLISAPAPPTPLTSVVEVDVTLAVRHAESCGVPLLVLLIQEVARAMPHPVTLHVLRYSASGVESTLVPHASDLSVAGIGQALSRVPEDGAADIDIVDVSALDLQSTILELGDRQPAALSVGVVTPRVAVGADGVIAFRSTVQLTLTRNPHLLGLVPAAGVLSAVRHGMERPR